MSLNQAVGPTMPGIASGGVFGYSRTLDPPYNPATHVLGAVGNVSAGMVTVSPAGIANGGSTLANNGANFGPDTSGTTTSGWQEAINSLRSITAYDSAGNAVAGKAGVILPLGGAVHQGTGTIVCPYGQVTILGQGVSDYYSLQNLTPYQDLGGTVYVTTAGQAFSCPPTSHNTPACNLTMTNVEFRGVDPSVAQTTLAPPFVDLSGVEAGYVNNLSIYDVKKSGGLGNNLFQMLGVAGGADTDRLLMTNIRAAGGNQCCNLSRAHLTIIGALFGFCTNAVSAFGCCLQHYQNLDNTLKAIQLFGSPGPGLVIVPYFSDPQTPQVYEQFMFEDLVHYVGIGAGATTGTAVFLNPCWNAEGVDPTIDIPATCPARFTFMSKYEQDQTGLYSPARVLHLAPAKFSVTAETSGTAFPVLPYDAVYVVTTVGGMTALTLDGTAVATTVGMPILVGAGHTLIATWAGSAPVFELIPQ